MRLLLFVIFIVAIIFAVYYFLGEESPFELSLAPSETCNEILERRDPKIIDDGEEITVPKNEYTDGFKYFFHLCALRVSE